MPASRRLAAFCLAACLASPALAAPLSESDRLALQDLQRRYVEGWLRNDREAVMSVMAEDAVFIPHDGVMPRSGAPAISEFWFPGGRVVGRVPHYEQQVTNISGDDSQAVIYGRFDLRYELDRTRYTWIGNFLIVARKEGPHWRVSHMMANDADPTIETVAAEPSGPGEPDAARTRAHPLR